MTPYPRPQLVRDHWLSLDGPWKFTFDDARRWKHPADGIDWNRRIQVPFPPESVASGIGDRDFHRACWYEREFELRPEKGRVLLHFGAVDYAACVWVNRHLVAKHEGGHTPFTADITEALAECGHQVVTV